MNNINDKMGWCVASEMSKSVRNLYLCASPDCVHQPRYYVDNMTYCGKHVIEPLLETALRNGKIRNEAAKVPA